MVEHRTLHLATPDHSDIVCIAPLHNRLLVRFDAPTKIRIEKWLYATIHHRLKITDQVIRPGILHSLIRMQKIVPNLRTKSNTGPILIACRLFGFSLFFFNAGKLCTKHFVGGRPIFVLAPLVLTLHDNVGWQVRQPYGTICFINMLAACSTGAIGIDSHFGRVNFYLSFISHLGSHINRRKTRLTFPLRVEWTDANQSMHAGFTFEISVRHRTTNRERCTVDSRFIIVLAVKQF